MNFEEQVIFLSGSRSIHALPKEVQKRLHGIMDKGFFLIVGDAHGADEAFQTYLMEHKYQRVAVYCPGYRCRANKGDWHVHQVQVPDYKRGREFYTHRDKQMALDAHYGLVLWDGKSPGSKTNIHTMALLKKKSLVYHNPTQSFQVVTRRNIQTFNQR